jgi:hypothetical protein
MNGTRLDAFCSGSFVAELAKSFGCYDDSCFTEILGEFRYNIAFSTTTLRIPFQLL